MKKKTITIAGKKVTLAYCYATEIAFTEYTGESFQSYIRAAANQTGTDTKKMLYAIMSAVMAWAQYEGTEPAITDRQLLYEATPEQFGAAYTAVLELFAAFYKLPLGDKQESTKEDGGKKKN